MGSTRTTGSQLLVPHIRLLEAHPCQRRACKQSEAAGSLADIAATLAGVACTISVHCGGGN